MDPFGCLGVHHLLRYISLTSRSASMEELFRGELCCCFTEDLQQRFLSSPHVSPLVLVNEWITIFIRKYGFRKTKFAGSKHLNTEVCGMSSCYGHLI
ncbi:uncharacterized protein LOC120350349 isoform X2 [Nilaparvata lugens]|uniref:uncharacterized protein LOC120350349 isoform X2 n=1 Tax=Nilaparvata lugens TaxID=108931 RepID=UPI00193C9394|nr:uncharacterized protein LOC120350349 isoform X2 [Nilaparvata lugens]